MTLKLLTSVYLAGWPVHPSHTQPHLHAGHSVRPGGQPSPAAALPKGLRPVQSEAGPSQAVPGQAVGTAPLMPVDARSALSAGQPAQPRGPVAAVQTGPRPMPMPSPHTSAQTSMQQPHTPGMSARPPTGEEMHALVLLLTSRLLAASLRLWDFLLIHSSAASAGDASTQDLVCKTGPRPPAPGQQQASTQRPPVASNVQLRPPAYPAAHVNPQTRPQHPGNFQVESGSPTKGST